MSRYWNEKEDVPNFSIVARDVLGVIFLLVALSMWGCPQYNVWQTGLQGQAELRHAEQSKQIAIQEAHAKYESSKLLAQADIERAKGAAEANRIIGDSLKQNEEYLRYLWVTEVAGKDVDKTVVYVPTEANVPILEANRLRVAPKVEK